MRSSSLSQGSVSNSMAICYATATPKEPSLTPELASYPRKPRKVSAQPTPAAVSKADTLPAFAVLAPEITAQQTPSATETQHRTPEERTPAGSTTRASAQAPTPSNGPTSVVSRPSPEATVFYGESNFITLMPDRHQREGDDQLEAQDEDMRHHRNHHAPPLNIVVSRAEMSGVSGNTPPSAYNVTESLPASTMRHLREEGALEFPSQKDYIPALEAYFAWFHPAFPIVDRPLTAYHIKNGTISPLLLNAMLFIGSTYCSDEIIGNIGFQDRAEAKNRFYTKARLLYNADWEHDKIALIQSVFLMSFWRGGPADIRDVRYWLGVVISLAESQGLHRS